MKDIKTNAAKMRSILAILAITLVFTMTVVDCDNGTTPPSGKTLVSIAVTTQPTKTVYNIDEALETAGLVVTATYSDGTTAAVTGFTTSGFSSATAGQKTVTVTYEGKTATFTVTVTASVHVHQWGDWVVTKAPTETEEGEETRTCAHDATHQETRAGAAALGHDWGDWAVTTPATYASAGIETRVCNHDPSHTETRPVPQLIYTASSVSDIQTFLSSQLTNTAATAYTVKLNVNSLTTPTNIRTTLNNAAGKYVILDLSGCTFTSIGNSAFSGCTNLTSVTIGNSVTSIGNSAFYNCTSLTAINVDAGNSAYSSENGVLFNKDKTTLIQYPAAKTGSTFSIPDSVTSIGDSAFSGCTNLTSVTIGNGVTSIGQSAFSRCTSLTSVTIPNSVTTIGSWAFDCTSLAEINVDAGNSAYCSENGVLYNKDKTVLHTYLAGKTGSTFTIPDSVTSIGNNAFYRCTFTNITIPNGVNSIGNYAFTYCTNLASVTIESGVTSIGNNVFSRCTSLTSVTFATGSNIPDANFGNNAFPEGSTGDGGNTLKTAYSTGKAGTYKRASGGSTWEKQL